MVEDAAMNDEQKQATLGAEASGSARLEEMEVASAASRALGLPVDGIELVRLPGHASARTYYRARAARRPGSPSVVVMVLPGGDGKGEEVGSDSNGSELPFIAVQRYLDELGVRVPEIVTSDLETGLLVLEDLGDETMEAALVAGGQALRGRLYGKAVDQLAFMRAQAELSPRPGLLPFTRSFEYELLRWELDHFIEWGLEEGRGVSLSPAESEVVGDAFCDIASRLSRLPRGLTHRDYQSRNLMVVGDGLAMIDFQDALLGPMVYDLVALLRDSYVVLERGFVDTMLDRYCDARRALGLTVVEREELDVQFDLQTIQRKLKDAGRFVFIERVKSNPDFLPYVPASLGYVAEALSRMPEYGALHEVLGAHVPELRPK